MWRLLPIVAVMGVIACGGGTDPTSTPVPTSTPDLEATVQARAAATEAARPTPEPTQDIEAPQIAQYLADMEPVLQDSADNRARFEAEAVQFVAGIDISDVDALIATIPGALPVIDDALNDLTFLLSDFLRIRPIPDAVTDFHNLYLESLQNQLLELEGLRAAVETAESDPVNAFLAAQTLPSIADELNRYDDRIETGLKELRDRVGQ